MAVKISLCLIVGNSQEYIERCLTSFAGAYDEICIVRAIGSLHPDDTLGIAELKFGARTSEYYNAPANVLWPHVDDFAAARQQSFDMARGDYCLWVDTDDVLKPGGAEKIRRHAEDGSFACFMFPYEIFGKNVTIMRDRMMRKDCGYWRYPIHENFKYNVEPVTAAIDDGVVIQHLPHLSKTGGNERNLRILESIPAAEMNVGLKYHLFGEYMCAGRVAEGIELATQLLTEEEMGKDERYDLLLSLVVQSPDLHRRIDLLHEAYKTDPLRREALGTLACTLMDLARPVEALAYARQMVATAQPAEPSWNSRLPFYGYTGDDIFCQTLRANGLMQQADILRRESLKRHGGPLIALLHATRGRPVQASRCRKAWLDLAAFPGQIEHIFAIDQDDKDSQVLRRMNHVILPPGGGCARAWNVSAMSTTAPILVQLSDDWLPVPKWDELIIERFGDQVEKPRVLAISDGHRTDALLCMAIFTRQYLFEDYFIFHPRFTGVYSDNWFTELAYQRNAVIEARDIVFQHRHPAFVESGEGQVAGGQGGKLSPLAHRPSTLATWDETYSAQNAPERYAHGLAVIEHLRTGNDWSSVPGWFNYWLFYEDIAAQLRDGDTVAEIGVWLGRSIIYLAQECRRLGKRVKFIAVDTFAGEVGQTLHLATVAKHGGSVRAAFEANLARCGVAADFTVIEGDSAASAAQVPDDSLAFCFIDAAHDYASVKADIAAWSPKVKLAGTFAGHDAQWEEVARAVKESLPAAHVGPVIWVHQKQSQLTPIKITG